MLEEIYIGNFNEIIDFRNKMQLNKEDSIIILGDAGICWRKDKKDMKEYIERWEQVDDTPMLYFIDGNHESFDILNSLPTYNGEGVLSEHIRWLKRGTVKDFNGKKCLCIGGADSVDKFRRIKHLSWWEDEQITQEDIDRCPIGTYDYVFSHACPLSIFKDNSMYLSDPQYIDIDFDHTSEERLDQLKDKIQFNNWWFRTLSQKY